MDAEEKRSNLGIVSLWAAFCLFALALRLEVITAVFQSILRVRQFP